MTRVKIAVSLPAHLVAAAKKAVRDGKAASVSGFVEEALAAHVEDDDFGAWIHQLLEESGGPMTEEERAWVDSVFGR